MRIRQTQPIVALAAVVLLASVPYVAAQGSGIKYQYAIVIVSLTTDDIGTLVSGFLPISLPITKTLWKSDKK